MEGGKPKSNICEILSVLAILTRFAVENLYYIFKLWGAIANDSSTLECHYSFPLHSHTHHRQLLLLSRILMNFVLPLIVASWRVIGYDMFLFLTPWLPCCLSELRKYEKYKRAYWEKKGAKILENKPSWVKDSNNKRSKVWQEHINDYW